MNCFQRSTRIDAFGSGVLFQVAARTGTMLEPVKAAVAPTPTLRTSRLLKSLIVRSPCYRLFAWLVVLIGSSLVSAGANLGLQALAGRVVEQMHQRRVRLEPDLVARTELVTLAEDRDDLLAAELGKHLGLRSRRLDHHDLGFGAV